MTETVPAGVSAPQDRAGEQPSRAPGDVASLAAGRAIAEAMIIDRPAPGQIKIVDAAAARLLKFSFDLASCKLTVLDVDAILIFPDGGKIVMPAFALQLIGAEPPATVFNGASIEPHLLLAQAGDIRLMDQLPEFALSDTARPDAKAEAPQPAAQVVQVTATQQYGHTPGPTTRPFVVEDNGNGNSLVETSARYARRVDVEAASSTSVRGEGALTENSQKTAAPDSTQPRIDVVNAAPAFTSSDTAAQPENAMFVMRLTASDPDAADRLTYAIVSGPDAARFAVNGGSGDLYFIRPPDFESRASSAGTNTYEIIVTVSDGAVTTGQTLSITVENVNEAPDSISLGSTSVDEGAATGTLVGTAVGSDPDAGARMTYAFAAGGDAGGRFAIDATTGAITVLRGDLIDFEASQSQLVIIRATDQAGLSTDRSVVLTVNDRNDAPIITSNGGGSSAAIAASENLTTLTTVFATDADAGSIVTYAIAGGADAARFVIDRVTGVLSFVAGIDFEMPSDANGDNIYNVVVEASDGRGGIDQQSLAVAVVNANDPPQDLSLSANTVPENAANGTLVGFAQATDPDANAVLTYSLVSGGDAGGRFAIDAATGAITVADGGRLDFEAGPTQTIIVRATDQGGLFTERVFVINLTDVNEAPTIISDGGGPTAALTVIEGAALASRVLAVDPENAAIAYSIAGGADAGRFTIDTATGQIAFLSAPDFETPGDANGDNVYELVVSATDGAFTDVQTLTISIADRSEAPVITSNGGGAAASILVLEGTTGVGVVTATDEDAGSTLAFAIVGGADAARFAINAATGVLTLIAPPDFESPSDADGNNAYDVIVQVSDGALVDTQAIQVLVVNQNDAPVITSNGGGPTATVTALENGTFATTVQAVDPDASTTLIYTISGGADDSRFTINSSTGVLSFIGAPNFEAPDDVGGDGIYDVQVQVLDGLGGMDTQAIAVTVANQNEAPVITSNGGGGASAVSIAENSLAVTTVVATDPDSGAVLGYAIAGGADAARFTINAATGALTFVGAPDFDIPGDADGDNVYDVVVRVSDGLGGTDQQAIAVTVLNVNEAPVITSGGGGATATTAVQENDTAIMTVTAADPDAGTTLTFTLVGGADASRFTINPTTGALSFVAPPDFETPADTGGDNTYDVIVQVADGMGGTDVQSISVAVTNRNEAPVITSSGGGGTASISISENTAAVATVTAADPDAGAAFTFGIAGGADASRFAINAATGVLTFLTAPNHEGPTDADGDNVYDVIVQVADGLGGLDAQAISVSVTNVNEAPVITSNGGGATASIARAENGVAVTTVTAIDPDAGAARTFSIVGGADASRFAINPTTGVLIFVTPPNHEAPTDFDGDNVYEVTVQVSDSLGGIDTQAIAVTVANENETPIITSNGGGATASLTIAENTAAVTTVTAVDPDAGAVLGYSIAGGADAARFSINATTGVLTFVTPPDHDIPGDAGADNVYDVIVQVSDGLGGVAAQAIEVTVANQNEAPVITSNGGGATATVSIGENATAIMTVAADDPDSGATLTYSISGGTDAARFTINASTGVLSFTGAPNFEAPTDAGGDNTYDVTIQVADGLGGIDTQAIAVTVTDQNEAPVITSNGGGSAATLSIAENNAFVTTVTATDPDAGATRSYSIAGGADAALFTIDAATGVLTFVGTPDLEAPTDFGGDNIYDVVVQVADGLGGIDTQAIAVTVTNQNEAPVITSDGGGPTASVTAAENTLAVTTVMATDPDAGAARTYSIAGGLDAARFTIDAMTGVLTFVAAPNFEIPADSGGDNIYDVIVQVADGLGGIDTQAIAVTVTNQNEAPVITSSGGGPTASITVAENTTSVTTVAAADPDASTTLTYSIAGGADAARFAIDAGTGALTFLAPPNHEGPLDAGGDNIYNVVVRVSDGLLSDDQAIAVTVADMNDNAPVITSDGGGPLAFVLMDENTTAVTTVTATDADAGTILNFSIVGGADSARFVMNAITGVLTFVAPPDAENPADSGGDGIYDVVVRVSDGVNTDDQAIAVTVLNVNDNPPAITSNGGGVSAALSLAENGAAVTTVTASDPDSGAVLTYSIAGGADAGRFAINAATGVLSFLSAPNFEAPNDSDGNNIYDVVVRVSDGASTDDQAISVTVTDANDNQPVITSNGGGATADLSVAENLVGVTTVSANDADPTSVLTYSIAGGADAAFFSINASTGELRFVSARDFETPADAGLNNIYDVVVRVSDGVNTDDQAIAVTVTNQTIIINGSNDPLIPDALNLFGASEDIYAELNAGDDIILGNSLSMTAFGNDGNDSITGGSGRDSFFGGAGNDTLLGSGGADSLSGGEGDDRLDGGGGADTLLGGGGVDRLTYNNDSVGVTIDLSTNSASGVGSEAAGDVISGFEAVSGGTGADNLSGDGGANTLTGNGGNDTLSGGAGNDFIDGGTGDDSVSGGEGNDLITGNSGADTLDGGADVDWLDFSASSAGISVNLQTGAMSSGDAQGDTAVNFENLVGGSGNDTLAGTDSFNTVHGYFGADTVLGLGGNDTLFGDYVVDQVGVDGADLVDGGSGDDFIYGHGNDDTLVGGSGNDSIDGGAGSDIAVFSGARSDYTIAIVAGVITVTDNRGALGDGTDSLVNVEALQFADGLIGAGSIADIVGTGGSDPALTGGIEANVIRGLAGMDTLTGGAGNDRLEGGADDDVVAGGAGADIMIGGTGDDTLLYASSTAGVTVNLATNTVSSAAGSEADGDAILDFENVTGGSGADSLTGNNGSNELHGGGDSDTLSGANGDDYLDGGAGADLIHGGGDADTILGGAGADTLEGGSGSDWLVYDTDTTGVAVSLLGGTASGGDAQGDVFSGFESLRGGSGNDTLQGTLAANEIRGFHGADTIEGLGGDDTLLGDGLSEDALNGGDVVDGGYGNDVVSGQGGADTLIGGVGDDTLDGGTGADTAVFTGMRSDYHVTNALGVVTVTDLRGDGRDGTDVVGNVEAFEFADGVIALADVADIEGGLAGDTLGSASSAAVISGDGGADSLTGGAGDDLIHGAGRNLLVNRGFDNALANWNPSGNVVSAGTFGSVTSGNAAIFSAGDSANNGILTQTVSTAAGTVYTLSLEAGAYSFTETSQQLRVEIISGGTTVVDQTITVAGSLSQIFEGLQFSFIGQGTTTTIRLSDSSTVTTSTDLLIDAVSLTADTASADTLLGGDGFDTLHGGSGADSMLGGLGNDVLLGGAGDDVLRGGAGGDVISGGDDVDVIFGDDGSDRLSGGRGADTILGGAGDDIIHLGEGAGRAIGGDGADTIVGGDDVGVVNWKAASYEESTAAVSINLATGVVSGGSAAGDVLRQMNFVIGSGFNDTLTGDGAANYLFGLDGADSIDGGDGNDTLLGQDFGGDALPDGNDTLNGGSGDDDIHGQAGNDSMTGGSGNDTIYGGLGDDTIIGGANNDSVYGGDGADLFIEGTSDGDNRFFGDAGSDTLQGGLNGANIGFAGDFGAANSIEVISNGGFSNVSVYGDDDSNLLDFSATTMVGIAEINGGDGNDTIIGSAGADNIVDDGGSDSLFGGGGADTLDGGGGNDTLNGTASVTPRLFGGSGDDLLILDTAKLEQGGTVASGGSGQDELRLLDNGSLNPVLEPVFDLVGKVSGIERIDASAADVVLDARDLTASHVRSILGISGPSTTGTLTLDLDGNDQFSIAAGEHTSQAGNVTTFYSDATLTDEIARVAVV
jgi:Ca2+-binding RTX toxin-like protein